MAEAAIDFHVHLPTPDWLDGSMAGYVEAAEAYFRSPVQRGSLADLAERYRALNVRAVLLAWDAETATGRPRVPNETVAAALRHSGLPCEGVNMFLADGEAAFQEVFHVHLHVIPRTPGDGFRIKAKWRRPSRTELESVAEQVRGGLTRP